MTILDHLRRAIRSAAVYNPDVQAAPACILWPDRDRQWEPVVSRLRAEIPELLILGDYAPETRTGPAIWLRCVLANRIGDLSIPGDRPPVLYLPGVGRADLRAVENCPEPLKPLAELVFRGVIWSQVNGRDWSLLAFLQSDQGGLGLNAARDKETRHAMQLALHRFLDEDLDRLAGKRLDRDYFNTLLTGGDPIRDLLQWIDRPETFRESRSAAEWNAFVSVCKSQIGFDPGKQGHLGAAAKLAGQQGPWQAVWERFAEAPRRYPDIPAHIRKCSPPDDSLFWHSGDGPHHGWPQWNQARETALCQDLIALEAVPPHKARKSLRELESRHGNRRSLVWAELGEAPLARALQPLAILAEITANGLAAGTIQDLVAGYRHGGWEADEAVVWALSFVDGPQNLAAVSAAIRAVYLPWAEESARHLQHTAEAMGYPGGALRDAPPPLTPAGECVLFVDGLRFDVAKRLAESLETLGFQVSEKPVWAALPSVTATGKPAVSPVRDQIEGRECGADFEPVIAETGQSLKGGGPLKKRLQAAGWTVLEGAETGNGQGNGWCEFGDLDHEGHDRGWKLAHRMDGLRKEIRDRVAALLAAGWKTVHVVTDHGFPGARPPLPGCSFTMSPGSGGSCASTTWSASTRCPGFPSIRRTA